MSRTPKSSARLPLAEPVLRPSFRRERRALNNGVFPVAGCDEAGRGPLAGPVVAAAVVLDPKRVPRGLNDSKKLDPETREKLHAKICANAEVSVAIAPPWRIDRDNIEVSCDCQAVVSGDAILASIAAASIVAKVTRDRLMTRLGLLYPGYGFEQHKGYSVPEHCKALVRLGPTIHHRRSFAPVAASYGDPIVVEEAEVFAAQTESLPL